MDSFAQRRYGAVEKLFAITLLLLTITVINVNGRLTKRPYGDTVQVSRLYLYSFRSGRVKCLAFVYHCAVVLCMLCVCVFMGLIHHTSPTNISPCISTDSHITGSGFTVH